MREDTIVEQATAKEITHEDVGMVRRFGAEFRRADESYVSALSLMAPVFELTLFDVTIVDGEKAVLECRVAATPAAEVTWYVGANKHETSRGLSPTAACFLFRTPIPHFHSEILSVFMVDDA